MYPQKESYLAPALAILCGGFSTRLGTDKGLFKPLGDESLVVRQLRLFSEHYPEILVVVKDEDQRQLYLEELDQNGYSHITVVSDEAYCPYSADAALSGIQTALKATTHEQIIVLPVDLLGVRPLHTKKLTTEAQVFSDANDYYAFPSLWQTQDLTRINALALAGSLSVKGALRSLKAKPIAVEDYAEELQINGNTKEEITRYFGEPLLDKQNRRLHYLRFSIIEACNLSCNYCLPDGFPEWYRHKARLSTDEIKIVLKGFKLMGFRKVRFTGGEPTLHKGCLEAVATARKIGYEEIAMTTNGLLIKDLKTWMDQGLTSLNVSLDTLDQDTFVKISKSGDIKKVIGLIEEAAKLGLKVKVNTVLQRSFNGSQASISSLIDWALPLPITLRFIELMDTKLNGDFAKSERVLGSEIIPLIETKGLKVENTKAGINLLGPATDYSSQDYPAKIGFINPISCNFCDACNRLRITAKGNLRLCLFGENETKLDLQSADLVASGVRGALGDKPKQHYLLDGKVGNVSTFRTIGG